MDPMGSHFIRADRYIKQHAPEFTDLMRIYTLGAVHQHTKLLNNGIGRMDAEPINVSNYPGREVFGFEVMFSGLK